MIDREGGSGMKGLRRSRFSAWRRHQAQSGGTDRSPPNERG